MDKPSPKYAATSYLQKLAALSAIVTSLTAVIMTSKWANGTDTADGYLGGLNWRDKIFNWHPLMMISGLIFCGTTSLVSYRALPFTKAVTKAIHVLCHTGAVICLSIGFSAVYISHNNSNHAREPDSFYSNFTSLHSFIGLGAIILYSQNYFLGIIHYMLPISDSLKKAYMPSHIFLGLFSFVAACMAVATGIMELTSTCYYDVTSPDVNPAEHYHELSGGCKLANGIGVMVVLTLFLVAYALLDINNRSALSESAADEDHKSDLRHPLTKSEYA